MIPFLARKSISDVVHFRDALDTDFTGYLGIYNFYSTKRNIFTLYHLLFSVRHN